MEQAPRQSIPSTAPDRGTEGLGIRAREQRLLLLLLEASQLLQGLIAPPPDSRPLCCLLLPATVPSPNSRPPGLASKGHSQQG